ncbi:MAG: TRAP transporter fused permease subunit [Oceanospirillales bacterium]|nr:TRAP transporter fused permease subunit [Oceanospirillales bacterium]MBR9886121.1 TRAP transporter fused permease subunit [Oceanospirillales bacterium]
MLVNFYSVFGLITGLAIALAGLANVLPTFDVLPRLGPFPVEWYRPLFFWLCILAILSRQLMKNHGSIRLLINLSLVVATGYICWDSYQIGQILVDDIYFFDTREGWIATLATIMTAWICWQLWGAPIAILGLLAFLYLATGQYWPGPMAIAPSNIAETLAANLWYSIDQGILGSILGIVLTTVLPFIILGSLLEGVGAGNSMIRIAFYAMRNFKGGPAYAAIAASALFGTVSGSAVANVVGTGVVTIPMIRKRGFNANFAGAVEATASTGGQILPPIMGAAALVMADIVGVSYLSVILAVLIPALAYYISLFVSVYFEAQKLDIQTTDISDVEKPETQDWLNLILVFGPIVLIVWLLIGGMSPAGASISALLLLVVLSFINPAIRKKPARIMTSFASGGHTVAELVIAISIVGIVVATMQATGVPSKLAVLLTDAANSSLIMALIIAAGGCIILGMGMPTLPAYIAIISVMGTTLQQMGLDLLTAHMFVFFFGVASVITPPVAIAAYAAASVSQGRPIATAVESSRIGAMIFLIPFAFALDPVLLLNSGSDAPVEIIHLIIAIISLLTAIYLAMSALVGFDCRKLGVAERLVLFALALALLSPFFWLKLTGFLLGAALVMKRKMAPRNSMVLTRS